MYQSLKSSKTLGEVIGEEKRPLTCPRRIWIVGGGRFGRAAMHRLMALYPDAALVVVDVISLSEMPSNVETVLADGVTWLVEKVTSATDDTLIIPALPLHLAAEWLKQVTEREGGAVTNITLTDRFLATLPNPFRIHDWQAAVSHADFICPPNCSEPDEICSFTGKSHPFPLFMILRAIDTTGLYPIVLQSRQLAPGVGGFPAQDLLALFRMAHSRREKPLLVGTSCKCHGIIDGMRLMAENEPPNMRR